MESPTTSTQGSLEKLLRDLTPKGVMSLDDSSINYNSLLGDEVNISFYNQYICVTLEIQ